MVGHAVGWWCGCCRCVVREHMIVCVCEKITGSFEKLTVHPDDTVKLKIYPGARLPGILIKIKQ